MYASLVVRETTGQHHLTLTQTYKKDARVSANVGKEYSAIFLTFVGDQFDNCVDIYLKTQYIFKKKEKYIIYPLVRNLSRAPEPFFLLQGNRFSTFWRNITFNNILFFLTSSSVKACRLLSNVSRIYLEFHLRDTSKVKIWH